MAIAGMTRCAARRVRIEDGELVPAGMIEEVPPRVTYTDRTGDRLGALADALGPLCAGRTVRIDVTGGQYLRLKAMIGAGNALD